MSDTGDFKCYNSALTCGCSACADACIECKSQSWRNAELIVLAGVMLILLGGLDLALMLEHGYASWWLLLNPILHIITLVAAGIFFVLLGLVKLKD